MASNIMNDILKWSVFWKIFCGGGPFFCLGGGGGSDGLDPGLDSGMTQQSHNNKVIVCEQFSGKHQPVGLLLHSEYFWKYAMFW